MNILSPASGNYKTAKSEKSGEYVGGIVYLAPSTTSGLGNLCKFASKGCKHVCLFTAGRGVMSNVRAGRLRKTTLFFKQQGLFFETLHADIARLQRKALKLKKTAFVRLNGTSDINYANYRVFNGKNVFEEFPDVTFYDYTADLDKALNNQESNYHLTFSKKENNDIKVQRALNAGINVAVVFRDKAIPEKYLGYNVINGDKTDLRFEEGNQGAVIGLYAKGKARKDVSGFVVDIPQEQSESIAV